MASETEKYRSLTMPYLVGNGLDIGSGGDPVIPSAIQVELPPSEYARYRSGDVGGFPVQWHGSALNLPFKDDVCDFVYSSHLLEDFEDWMPCLSEWTRVLRPGGKLVLLVPEQGLWREALLRGQPPNCAHKHEATVGELSTYAGMFGWNVLEDRLTGLYPGDYTILFVAEKHRSL